MRRWLAGLRRALGRGWRADPAALRELERTLAAIRFEPRASLGPEVLARARRGEPLPAPPASGWGRRLVWAVPGIVVAAVLAGALGVPSRDRDERRLDRCCFDLDGAGAVDDGILVVARSGELVARVTLYEDADGSRSFTAGDPIRLAPGGARATAGGLALGLVTLHHCCWDLDAGGRDDDGIMVVSAPPDRVLLAAIYEDPSGAGTASGGWVLRYVLR